MNNIRLHAKTNSMNYLGAKLIKCNDYLREADSSRSRIPEPNIEQMTFPADKKGPVWGQTRDKLGTEYKLGVRGHSGRSLWGQESV
jgi:hypothetical protein